MNGNVLPRTGIFIRFLSVLVLSLGLAPSTHAAEKITLCHGMVAVALIPLARLAGFYAEEGLDVQTRKLPSGVQALNAMLKGECQLAGSSLPATVTQSLTRDDFRVLAAISTSSNYEKIVARQDLGIRRPADLRGRRVAVVEGSSAHYFLDTFLAAHGMSPSEVSKVYLPAERVNSAVLEGKAEAAAHWGPYVLDLARALGPRGVVMDAPGLVIGPYLLLARRDFAQARPNVLHALLRALVKAEDLAHRQPARAQALLAPYFGLGAEDLAYAWKEQDFEIHLQQSLLFSLESVARWQIGQRPPGSRPPMPDYLNLLLAAPLRAVTPAAVTVID